jgi:hypothetical protein
MTNIKQEQTLIIDIVALDAYTLAAREGCDGSIVDVEPVFALMVANKTRTFSHSLVHILDVSLGSIRCRVIIKVVKKVGPIEVVLEHITASHDPK